MMLGSLRSNPLPWLPLRISGNSFAYKAQFLGLVLSSMDQMVWKAWAPPKAKFFAWLAIQDRIWTAGRLQKRGWPNCGLCTLCKREEESGPHLFFKCRFTIRLQNLVIAKLGLHHMDTSMWHLESLVKEWWTNRTGAGVPNRKAMASLTMLVSWTIWNERNARVFRNKSAPPPFLLNNIICEANFWITAGAKNQETLFCVSNLPCRVKVCPCNKLYPLLI